VIAPDERTVTWPHGRPCAPEGAAFDAAAVHWRRLETDDGGLFDDEDVIDAPVVPPTVIGGASPEHAIAIAAAIPAPAAAGSVDQRSA
jgi:3-isopropylmalate/(R)-2-methylmalate dehydratase large subunit